MSKKDKPTTVESKSIGFSSPLMLAISLIAASVGTGNIWRCPRVAATNGGAAFIIAYVIIMVLLIMPVMIGEHNMGRATRRGTPGCFRDFMGHRDENGKWVGNKKMTALGTFVEWIVIITAAYYIVVVAWITKYLYLSITGKAFVEDKVALFESVSNHNVSTVIIFIIIQCICLYGAYKGIGGIEKSTKVLLPILLGCLIILMIRSVTLPGANSGLNFMFDIDPKNLLTFTTWKEALIQALWSAGPGWAICIAYGVYSKRRSDSVVCEIVQGFGDMSVALLACLTILPALFATYGQQVALEYCGSGTNALAFIALTGVFETMGMAGRFFAALFWIALLCASITTQIAILSILLQPIADLGFKPGKCAIIGGILILAIGIPSAWSLDFFNCQDYVDGTGMVLAFSFSCFAFIKYGLNKMRTNFINNPYSGFKLGKWWNYSVGIAGPIVSLGLFGIWCVQAATNGENQFNFLSSTNFGTLLLWLGGGLLICFLINGWMNKRTAPTVFDGNDFPPIQDNGLSSKL